MGYAKLYTAQNEKENSLKNEWTNICNKYLKLFCDKHEYSYDPDGWVANDPGTVCMVGDMFVSMENIRYDIDNDIQEEKFEKWYWKSLEVFELTGVKYMNYENFCKECPDQWTEENLERVRQAKQRVIEAQDALEKEIENHKSQF